MAGAGQAQVNKARTERLSTRLAEHAANGRTQVVWTADYPSGGPRNVDLDEVACIDAIREAYPPFQRTYVFRESV